MRNEETKDPAAIVTGATQPKQAADTHDRWGWVEHSAWTQRMLTRLEESEPTTVWYGSPTDGLRRKGCLVWNTALALMVSLAETPLTGKPDALCGQPGYVVSRFKRLGFIGLLAPPTPHNIFEMNLLAGVLRWTLRWYV